MKPADDPVLPRADTEITDERSSVRPRAGAAPRRDGSTLPPAPASERVAELLRIGSALLADLPNGHPRAHLLRIAILRRDHALLASLVQELSGACSPRDE